jgi:hypothetical protein
MKLSEDIKNPQQTEDMNKETVNAPKRTDQPNPDPDKKPKEPWKNPDPTKPEKGHEIYADKKDASEKTKAPDTTEDSSVTTGSGTNTNAPSHKPGYPDTEEGDHKNSTNTDVENTDSPDSNEPQDIERNS